MNNQWHSKEFVAQWDRTVAQSSPSRALQAELLVDVVARVYQPGMVIADLGFGSGQIEERIFQKLPQARIVGVDSSKQMMELARSRLRPFAEQMTMIEHDLARIASLKLPEGPVEIVISIQTLHHLTFPEQQAIHNWVHALLEPGGFFLIVDKRTIGPPSSYTVCEAAWNSLENSAEWRTGRTYAEHLEHFRNKHDPPATLEQQLGWLTDAGFVATVLHCHLDRALLACQKPLVSQ